MVPSKSAIVVSYRLSIVTVALSLTIRPQFAIEYILRSNQQGVGHFGAKFGEEDADRWKPNSNTIWKRHGATVCKTIVLIIFRVVRQGAPRGSFKFLLRNLLWSFDKWR